VKPSRHPAIHNLAIVRLFAAATSTGAATLPIPDPTYSGNGDGIARIAVGLHSSVLEFGADPIFANDVE
jgi:hypothetical protein